MRLAALRRDQKADEKRATLPELPSRYLASKVPSFDAFALCISNARVRKTSSPETRHDGPVAHDRHHVGQSFPVVGSSSTRRMADGHRPPQPIRKIADHA
jgi:hypothetical protein